MFFYCVMYVDDSRKEKWFQFKPSKNVVNQRRQNNAAKNKKTNKIFLE